MIPSLSLPLILALLGQAPPAAREAPGEAAARLDFMKTSAAIYDLHPESGRGASYKLDREPIFRLNNPVSGVKDGAIFFWTEEGRPMASVQVFLIPNGMWLHEFTSLAPAPFMAERIGAGAVAWSPTRPGVEFQPVPGAPKPAETAEQRLRQMQGLAREFSAQDYFEDKSWQRLRLLAKPLARYGKPGGRIADGALFCFALGTDPEVFLMLEARQGEWQYAFAPMTAYALKGEWKGKEVWSLPWRKYAKDPTAPFHIREYKPEP